MNKNKEFYKRDHDLIIREKISMKSKKKDVVKSKKKEAIKRIRKPNSKDNNFIIIVGLSIGIAILLAVLICVFIFVVKDSKRVEKKQETEAVISEQIKKEKWEKETNSVTNSFTETFETEDSKKILQTNAAESIETQNTELESEDKEMNIRLDKMTKEQKIDQLFILNPIVIVNQNVENEADKVNKVNQVGELTKLAFSRMQLGGFVISENNTDDVTGRIQEFAADLKELANDTYDMPLFLAVGQMEKKLFEVEDSNGLTPDFVVNEANISNLNAANLQIKCFAEKPDAQQIVMALSENFDMLIVLDMEFDYSSVRAELITRLPEEKIDEKVSKIINEKMKLKSKVMAQESDETERENITDEKIQIIGHDQNTDMWKSNSDEESMSEKESDRVQIKNNSEALTND